METTTFTALCERAGRWWTIHVPQIEGLTAQVRSLDQAEVMTRKVIARHLGISAEAIKVDVLPNAPEPVGRALQARHIARQAAEAAVLATRDAIDALAGDGYAFHDTATMLSLSRAEIEHYGAVPFEAGDERAGTVVTELSAIQVRSAMSDAADERWMRLAIELAWQCPPSPTAYSVGAVVVDATGSEISRGFSREDDPVAHAEESALGKLAVGDPRLAGATIYSTLEPCSYRRSRPRTCTELIIAAGLHRVVVAWREPDLFVADCQGEELLAQAGLVVAELPDLAKLAAAPNRHLPL